MFFLLWKVNIIQYSVIPCSGHKACAGVLVFTVSITNYKALLRVTYDCICLKSSYKLKIMIIECIQKQCCVRASMSNTFWTSIEHTPWNTNAISLYYTVCNIRKCNTQLTCRYFVCLAEPALNSLHYGCLWWNMDGFLAVVCWASVSCCMWWVKRLKGNMDLKTKWFWPGCLNRSTVTHIQAAYILLKMALTHKG